MDGVNLLVEQLLSCDDSPRVQREGMLIALNISTRQPQSLLAGSHLEALIRMLEPDRGPALQEPAARVMCNLSEMGMQSKIALFKGGALPRLHTLLQPGIPESVRSTAAEAMKGIITVLTPSSRRALAQASLLPHNDAPRPRPAARAGAPKRSSPLATLSFTAASPHA